MHICVRNVDFCDLSLDINQKENPELLLDPAEKPWEFFALKLKVNEFFALDILFDIFIRTIFPPK